jgi:hypothetical protein
MHGKSIPLSGRLIGRGEIEHVKLEVPQFGRKYFCNLIKQELRGLGPIGIMEYWNNGLRESKNQEAFLLPTIPTCHADNTSQS